MESLKIAFYTDTFLPAHDGVVTSIMNFRKELMKRGHEVYIFASGNEKTKQMIGDKKDIYIIKGMKFKKYPQYNLALMPFTSASKLNEISPDIVHAHTPFIMGTWALAMAKMNKFPIVSTFHTMFTEKSVIQEYASKHAVSFLQKYSWKYARFYYNKCNAVMAPSYAIQALLEKKGIPDSLVVPNAVDINRFNNKVHGGKIRKKLLKNRNESLVLYVGRISREKKIETLLKAAKNLHNEDIRFTFVGTGPALNYYSKMSSRLGLNDKVSFEGFVDDKILPNYYASADLFCIPSTFETQGIVSIEAMASGKPVVGADSLALKEIIKNGKNGEKFVPNDSKSCAKKIKKVINNIDSYKETVQTAKKYSVEITTDELLKVYNRVINEVTV
ncbi:MAG: glycosyltransferase [Candidatus Micrarchaeales archaeon]